MLNLAHTAGALADDHRRSLQADADGYRLASTARSAKRVTRAAPVARRGWLTFLAAVARRAVA